MENPMLPITEEARVDAPETQIDVTLSLTGEEANQLIALLIENDMEELAAVITQAIDEAPANDESQALTDEIVAAQPRDM
jgi:hypothetical protein